MNGESLLKRIVQPVNKLDNDGEALTLVTKILANGDPVTDKNGIFLNQELSLNSYCNKATFHLYGATFTPQRLREMADELEAAIKEARDGASKVQD